MRRPIQLPRCPRGLGPDLVANVAKGLTEVLLIEAQRANPLEGRRKGGVRKLQDAKKKPAAVRYCGSNLWERRQGRERRQPEPEGEKGERRGAREAADRLGLCSNILHGAQLTRRQAVEDAEVAHPGDECGCWLCGTRRHEK